MDPSKVALLARYEAVRGGRPNYPEKLHQYQVCPKGLVTPRDHGFFPSKNHVIEEILNFFFANIYYFEYY